MSELLAVWVIGLFMGFGTGIILGGQVGFSRGVEATERRWAAWREHGNSIDTSHRGRDAWNSVNGF